MGLIYGEWRFRDGAVPTPEAIAHALAEATGLDVRLEPPHPASEDAITLELPQLREKLIKWRFGDDQLAVHGFVPAHPYVWENLDAVLAGFGGVPGTAEHAWRADPACAGLRRPWSSLKPAQRLLLQLPTLGAWRPFDALAARSG